MIEQPRRTYGIGPEPRRHRSNGWCVLINDVPVGRTHSTRWNAHLARVAIMRSSGLFPALDHHDPHSWCPYDDAIEELHE